jgi:hypothetical protein
LRRDLRTDEQLQLGFERKLQLQRLEHQLGFKR